MSEIVHIATTSVTSGLNSHASDGAFVAAKGSAAADGDLYYNTAVPAFRGYINGGWANFADLSTAQTLTNKSFSDSTCVFSDNADSTKKVALEVSGVTTGNTRVLTVPDFDLTLAGVASTQTLTNKTMSGASNTFTAIPLANQSSGASSAGQILVSTGSSACSWQTPPIAIAYRSTNLSLTTSTTTDVVADTEVIDSASAYDNTTGIFTVPAGQGGIYEIGASLILASSAAFNGSTEIFAFDLAGTQSMNLLQTVPVSASVNLHYSATVLVSLSASNTAKITAVQDSGSGHNIVGNIASRIWFRKVAG